MHIIERCQPQATSTCAQHQMECWPQWNRMLLQVRLMDRSRPWRQRRRWRRRRGLQPRRMGICRQGHSHPISSTLIIIALPAINHLLPPSLRLSIQQCPANLLQYVFAVCATCRVLSRLYQISIRIPNRHLLTRL